MADVSVNTVRVLVFCLARQRALIAYAGANG
jgi:hypothetical protein